MQRLSAVVLERDQRAVLRGLGRMGVLHLAPGEPGPDTAPLPPADHAAELAQADGMLVRIDGLRLALSLSPRQGDAADIPEIALSEAEGALRPIEEKASELLGRQQDLKRRMAQAASMLRQVLPFQGLDVPFDQLGGSIFFHFAVGLMSPENLETLRGRVGPRTVLLPLAEYEGRLPLVAVTARQRKDELESQLREGGFEPITFRAAADATAATFAQECREEQEFLSSDFAETGRLLARLARDSDEALARLNRAVFVERKVLEAEQEFPRTRETVLVTGWAPAEAVPAVWQMLQEVTRGRYVLQAQDPTSAADAEVPILLRHPWILRPFEMLVTGYGLPTYRELEPTLFVAITYVVMFGMMFGDAGHGAVLALGGIGILLAAKAPKVRNVGPLLLLLGLSSVGFGIYYGSYFGVTTWHGEELGAYPLSRHMLIGLMGVALAVGVAVISLGLVLNMINRFRRGDVVGGLLDKFGVAGAVFYWGVLALAMKYAAVQEAGLLWLVLVAVVVLPLAAVALKEPLQFILARWAARGAAHGHAAQEASLAEAVLGSLVDAFEMVIRLAANTLSFVRLAGYAISHAAILMATFVMVAQVQKAARGPLGDCLQVLLIVLGNAVAIVLEGTVALVQAVRLEYYEFFGKFFSGSGRAFQPFRFTVEKQGT
jgi:V/A-type H+-transporting ATPase subunit I